MATWRIISERSSIYYRIRHLGLLWSRGTFARPEGQIILGEGLSKAYVYASVPIASIQSGIRMRDRKVQGNRFLNEQAFPTTSFVSYEVRQGKHPSRFIALGELSLKGITYKVKLKFRIVEVKESQFGKVAHFKGELELDRRVFGIGSAASLLGRKVQLQIDAYGEKL